jgi:hypothetical protein
MFSVRVLQAGRVTPVSFSVPVVVQVPDADYDEEPAQYDQNRPNDVEPESVEEWTGDDEPDPGEQER